MNIFQLSEKTCPVEAASFHCSKHVVKMLLEVNQILCDAFIVNGIEAPYKKCNPNHPSTKWARQTYQNFQWTLSLGFALSNEYHKSCGKSHKCDDVLVWIRDNAHRINLPNNGLTTHAVAIPADAVCRSRFINFDQKPVWEQYRLYYVFDKPFAKWDKLNNTPQWFLDMRQKYANVLA